VRVVNVSDFNRRGKVQRKWENHPKSPDSIYIQATEYRGGPQITMNQIKSLLSLRSSE
jgi:hypothetical protein